MPAFQVFQMELVDARWRGLAYGIVSMAMSLFGGRIAAQWGYGRLFLIAVGLSLLGALVIWGMRRDPAVVVSGAQGYTTTGPSGHPGSNGFLGGEGRLRAGIVCGAGAGNMRDGLFVPHGGE